MSILWFAFGIYIIGVAIVLYIRPGIMFREDGGAWREFGLSGKGGYTVFPFWLFAVVWAFLSYTIATIGALMLTRVAMMSLLSTPSNIQSLRNAHIQPISEMTPPVEPIATPGYYVLDQSQAGPPRYVYFGQSPPGRTF